jgi:hypothetical protein
MKLFVSLDAASAAFGDGFCESYAALGFWACG